MSVSVTLVNPDSSIVDPQHSVADDDASLKSLFYRAYKIYSYRFRDNEEEHSLIHSRLSVEDQKMTITEVCRLFSRIAFCVERLSLFSPNEELEDISTCNLIFLLVPFILAELFSHADVKENRRDNLESSLLFWKQFLHSMERLHICSQLDLQRLNADLIDPVSRRERKIASYNEHQALDDQIKLLFRKKERLGFDPVSWTSEDWDDESERSLTIAILKRSVNESLDHIDIAEQELEILAMPGRPTMKESAGESFKKPFILTIKDPSELHEMYRSRVFKPFHIFPTFSLAEAGDWEMQLEAKRLGASQEKKKSSTTAEACDDSQIGDVSKEEEEEKERKERDWEDWKDENPKGIGNKNRNVG